MAKLTQIPTQDPRLDTNFSRISNIINGLLTLDNFNGIYLEGQTHATAHTEKLFKHGL